MRGGLANDAALARLQKLWQQCARSKHWPTVPETDEQIEFVRLWRELPSASGAADKLQRFEGALVGLALGDALGTLVAASNFDAATLATGMRAPAVLTTGANIAMTRAVAESLLAVSKHDAEDQMRRYLQWTRDAAAPACRPNSSARSRVWQWSKKTHAGTHDPKNLDPHSLSRTLAVALFMHADVGHGDRAAAEVSRTTQQSPLVLDLCRFWAALFIDALAGRDKETLATLHGPALQVLRKRHLKKPLKSFIEHPGTTQTATPNDVLGVTQAAVGSFATTSGFHDALIHVAASRVPAAATSLCGALAGAYYGIDAVPTEWRRQLGEDASLRSLARHLLS